SGRDATVRWSRALRVPGTVSRAVGGATAFPVRGRRAVRGRGSMTDAGDKERDVASDGAGSDETTSGRAGSDQADAAPDDGDSADATTETSPAVDPDPDEPHLSGPTGPQVIEGDSWDTAPGPSRSRSYAGRHHLEPTPLRRWAVVGAILVA